MYAANKSWYKLIEHCEGKHLVYSCGYTHTDNKHVVISLAGRTAT